MSKIIYVALENLPQRYTEMMNNALTPLVDKIVYPDIEIDKQIKRGQFLDIVNTCKFKAAQLQSIADMFNNGEVENGDTFLIGDIFFPGIEMIRYMADLLKIRVKVFGINYAGRADINDFVQQLGDWSDLSEAGYHDICDGIFVGSEDHKKHVCDYFAIPASKVHVTGYVWDLDYMKSFRDAIMPVEKEDFIIWPHRWCNEKGIQELCTYARSTDKQIIVTSSGPVKDYGDVPENITFKFNLSKLEYFTYMAKAKWYLSTGYQETFGYTIQEAIYFDCQILVPNRACYPEMVPGFCVYNHVGEIDYLFDKGIPPVDMLYTIRWDKNAVRMVDIIKSA